MTIYRAIDVWKRKSEEEAIQYRCFQIDEQEKYCVQSVDFYRRTTDRSQIEAFEQQHLELFLDEKPELRNNVYPTLKMAIEKLDEEFSDYFEE